jgi:chromosome segregation ATPase
MKQALHAKLSLYVVATVWAGAMPAQAQANSGGIYACTDANGRRITADRPIASCVDREQRVLGNTGVELRRVGPTLTDQERSAQEAKRRQDQAEQQRLREERSRARHAGALPNQGVHDAARAEAIAQVNDVIGVAQQRLVDLKERRRKLNTELEFYQNDPKKAPANLRRQLDDNTESQAEQQRFIKQQEEEKQRINQRFDAELQQLRKLWAELPPAAPRSH